MKAICSLVTVTSVFTLFYCDNFKMQQKLKQINPHNLLSNKHLNSSLYLLHHFYLFAKVL